MTLTQWLCENQALASIIMTGLCIVLGLLFIVAVAALLTWYSMRDWTYEKSLKEKAEREAKENNPEYQKKKTKLERIYEIIFIPILIVWTGYVIYSTPLAQGVFIGLFCAFAVLISASDLIKHKNPDLSNKLEGLAYIALASFAVWGIGFMLHEFYIWWVLHICRIM